MTDSTARRWLPSAPGLIATLLVATGVVLWMFVSKGLLFIAGLGAFGPGIVRELGLLKDQDEFQRQAAHRAGYHAYLIGGLAAVFVLAVLQWTDSSAEDAAEWVRFLVVTLWLTWMFSSLMAYWGAQRSTAILLRTVGSFWALFVVADLFGSGIRLPQNAHELWLGLLGLGAGIMFVGPFFFGAWAAYRWPRATGIALLGIGSIFLVWLGGPGPRPLATAFMTDLLLMGPLIASGIALLRQSAESAEVQTPPNHG